MVLLRDVWRLQMFDKEEKKKKNHIGQTPLWVRALLPVNVGRDGLIRRLVHAADSQPHKAFLPLDEPAVGRNHWQPHYWQQGEPTEDGAGSGQDRRWRASSRVMSLPSSAPLSHLGRCRNIHWRKPCRGARHLTFIHAGCCRHLKGNKGVWFISVIWVLPSDLCLLCFWCGHSMVNCDAEVFIKVEMSAGMGEEGERCITSLAVCVSQ